MKDVITVSREIPVIKIALTAKLRAGKDTVADHLHIRHSFDKVAFGGALKRNVNETFPWLTGPKKPRALLQQYGQLMREIDPQVWVRHVERKVNGIIDLRVNTGADRIGIVISDLRQPNEYEWAHANGFTIIRVTAPDDVRVGRAISAGDDFTVHDLAHETELAIDGFAVDYEIVNDGTVDDLKRKIDEILAEVNSH
jgi:dephospho-CoA kinase